MYGILVKFVARPGRRDELVEFLRWDAAVAKDTEPGTLRFDVWEVPEEFDAVYLYEAYSDPNAFAKHQANDPYNIFVNKIVPEMIDESRTVDLFRFANSLVSNADHR
jgi:(4S)-4-hydroxy-5-phosphonooxypentane-2,3-dione isomerase